MDFDHHCPWTGTCVGARNYRYFTFFVYACSGLCIAVFTSSVMVMKYEIELIESKSSTDPGEHVTSNFDALYQAASAQTTACILAVYTFFAFWSVFGLSFFHSFLICSGETTNENLKGTFMDWKNGNFDKKNYRRENDGNNCREETITTAGGRKIRVNANDFGPRKNCFRHWFSVRKKSLLPDMSEELFFP